MITTPRVRTSTPPGVVALVATLALVVGSSGGGPLVQAISSRLPSLGTMPDHAAARTGARTTAPTFRAGADGGLHVTAAGLRAVVRRSGLEVRTSASSAPVTVTGTWIGRPGARSALPQATPVASDTTATIARGPVVEWVHSQSGGLEQGWTIARRPSGAGALSLGLTITGAHVTKAATDALVLGTAGSAVDYSRLVVRDSTGAKVPSHFAVRGATARIVLGDAHARYPLVIDPNLSAVSTLDPPLNGGGSAFGSAVAIQDRWMVVGEQSARLQGEPTVGSGRVSVFFDVTGNGGWSKVKQLTTAGTPYVAPAYPNTTGLGSVVGLVVEPVGVTVFARLASAQVVLAWTIPGDPTSPSGAAVAPATFLQGIAANQWTLPAYSGVEDFGAAFAAGATELVVGAPQSTTGTVWTTDHDGDGLPDPVSERIGTAELFRRTAGFGTPYSYVTHIDPPNGIGTPTATRDIQQWFGSAVAYDPATGVIAIGAKGDDGVQTTTGGTQAAPVDTGTTNWNGAVDLFTPVTTSVPPNSWTMAQRITSAGNPAQARFGSAIAFAGPTDSLVVGAPQEATGTTFNPGGAAYLFDQSAPGLWTQVQAFSPNDPFTPADDTAVGTTSLGTAVAASPDGTRLYLGAPGETFNSAKGVQGAVQVWQRSGPTGTATDLTSLQGHVPDDSHGGIAESYGSSLAASNAAVAAGAPAWGNAAATFVGHVGTFVVSGTTYTPAIEIGPQTHQYGEQFGYTIAQDGDVMAVAMPGGYHGSGYGDGAVGIYDRTNTGWVLEKMAFPDAANYTATDGVTSLYGRSLALHVYRDNLGHDIGLALAIGSPEASVINPGAGGVAAAVSVPNTGNVGIWVRNGSPGTAFTHGELFSGGQEQTAANPGNTSQATANAYFGWSLAFTGDGSLIVGQPGDTGTHADTIQRFEGSTTAASSWTHQETVVDPTFINSDASGNREFGYQVAADGANVVAESYAADGHAVITRYTDGGPTTNLTYRSAFDSAVDGTYGTALKISGSRIAVSSVIASTTERVGIYRMVGDTAVREALLAPDPADPGGNRQFGESLDFNHGGSVTTLAIGADGADCNTSGQAFVYVAQLRADGSATWSRAATLVPTDSLPVVCAGTARTGFGAAVSNWPNNGGLLVGAPDAGVVATGAGRVYSFDPSSIQPPPGPTAFVDVHAPATMQVGANELKTAGLPPSLLSQHAEGSIAAASIGQIDLGTPGTPTAAPLADIPLKSVPLKSVPLKSVPLSDIPLKSVAGGWPALLAGSAWANSPLQSVLLSDVYDLPSVQALPIGALDLGGTALSSIPLMSVALGGTPLKSVPVSSVATDPITAWCTLLSHAGSDPSKIGLDCANPADPANGQVTILSAGLEGAPLDAVPLKSVPLKSVDLSAAPLKSVPLKSVPLKSVPLKSVPLKSVTIANTPLKSVPLKSVPLKSVPLKSVDLSAITLDGTPLKSVRLDAVDLANTPLKSVPLTSIAIANTPLKSVPLKSVPLKSVPLKSVPLKSVDLSRLNLAGTSLTDMALSSIDIANTPLKSVPLKSVDMSAVPLKSVPLKSVPLKSVPLKSVDLAALSIAGTPLKSVPLKSVDIDATPLKSVPLKSVPTSQLATLVDCTLVDCTSGTFADAVAAGAIRSGAQLGDLGDLLTGLSLADLIGVNGYTSDQLRAALGNLSVGDLTGFDTLTLEDMPQLWPYLTLGGIQSLLSGIRLGDLVFLDYTQAQLQAALDNIGISIGDVTDWDNVTLGDLGSALGDTTLGDLGGGLSGIRLGDLADAIHKASGGTYTAGDLGAALQQALPNATLGDITDWDNVTLGELSEFGDTTLGDLLSALSDGELSQLTLEDLLLSLLAPQQYPWSALDMTSVGAQALDQSPTGTPITVGYRADAPDGLPRTVQVSVQMPTGSRLDQSSIHTTWGTSAESVPAIDGDTATWTFHDVPAGADQSIAFNLQAPLTIGPASIKATAFLPDDDQIASDTAATTIQEAFEPNDTTATATPLPDNTIMLSHVSHAGDLDVFKFDVTQPGTRVSLNLSNLDADLDLVLYGPRAGSVTPTGSRSVSPVGADGSGAPPAQHSGSVTVAPASGNDVQAPTDLGSLGVIQTSMNRGRTDEQIDTGVLTQLGTYYVAVSGYNGAVDRKPYALRLKRFQTSSQPACPARQVTPGAVGTQLPATLPAGTNTVFVVNQSRMSGLYGDAAASGLMGDLAGFSTWLAAHPGLGIDPAVLTVDADQGVRDAYAAWDASPCLVAGANGVVSQIARLLNGYRQAGANIQNVVLVGGDDAVPFARVPDRTKVANETGYASTFSDAGNALYATFASSSVQTDNAYVDRSPYAFGDRTLYVPDTTIGRLVESPSEISTQLTDFEHASGKLAVNTGLVTGYDFLTDGAQAVARDASKTYRSVDSSLISETWTRQQLESAIAAIKPNLLSINSHFDHFRALPGAGNTTGDQSDLFTAAAVRGSLNGDLAGSVVFSMGCHSGLSASDLLLPAGDSRALDFAQAVSSQGGVFVGNTGFGYGDTDTVALSEQLMGDFAQRLDGSMSVGQALLYAKNAYFSGLATFTPYDEKVLHETTFYGLPFYRLDVPNPPQPPALPVPAVTPDPITGTDVATDHIVPTFVSRTGTNSTTYVAAQDPSTGKDTLTTVQDRPVEPRVDDQFAMPAGETSHDALVTGLTSTDYPNTNPYLFQPVVDSSGERQNVGVDTAFPTRPVQVNPALTPAGQAYDIAATAGYFRTAKPDGTGLERTYKSMDVATFFNGSNDFAPPTFSQVVAAAANNTLTVSAHVMDDRGGPDRVKRVYLLALVDPRPGVPTTWENVDLVRTAGTDEWTGSLPANGQHLEYILQAVDAAGNVAVTSDKAENFVDTAPAGTTPPPAPSPLRLSVSGPQGSAGWYTGTATVTATGGAGLSYEIVGEQAPTAYTGPFTVSGTGLHSIRVSSEDGQTQSITVPIDTVGPVARLTSPADGQTVPYQGSVTMDFGCVDNGSGPTTCIATLDGTPVSQGQTVTPTPGTHTVTVTAGPDVAGNPPSVRTVSHTFTVIGPLVLAVTGPHGSAGWFTGPVTVSASGGTTLTYELVGEQAPKPYTGPFGIGVDGVHTVRVTSADGQVQTVTVPIDSVGPQAQLTSPADGALVSATAGTTVSFRCTDAGSGPTTCTATLDGSPVTSGQSVRPTPGTHSVTVVAGPDVAGNAPSVPTVSHSFTVIAPPTVGSLGVTKAQDGAPTTVTVPFTGATPATYTATVSFGDGSQTTCASGTPGCSLTRNSAGGGTFTVSHTYGSSAVNSTVTATVSDQFGQSGSNTILVNRPTSLSATPALLQLLSGKVILKAGAISATLTASGAPLAGQTLTFTLPSGTLICTAITDANGFARCPSSLLLTVQMVLAGRYVVTFAGRDVYKGSATSASLIG